MKMRHLLCFLVFALNQCFSQQVDARIDTVNRDNLAQLVSHTLEQLYVETDKSRSLAAETKKRILTDAYLNLTTQQFAKQLTKDLQEQTGDGHLFLAYRAEQSDTPVNSPAEMDQIIADLRQTLRAGPGVGRGNSAGAINKMGGGPINSLAGFQKTNYGFVQTRNLEGNVGLIQIAKFAPPTPAALEVANAAMSMIANSDAIILDLRGTPGGVEAMASYIASYFFAEDHKLLMSAYFPFADYRIDSYTADVPHEKRRSKVPLYILTDRESFSAAEALAYTLQKFGRATVVGEASGGGGYAGQVVPIGLGMFLSVSVGRPEHPVTKQGWQKVGVVPDIPVQGQDALQKAQLAALKNLRQNGGNTKDLDEVIKRLERP